MKWADIWMTIFGKTQLYGINMGFWVSIGVVFIIVVLMNIIFWNVKGIRMQSNHKNEVW